MQFKELNLPGCYEIQSLLFEDVRGLFVKTFQISLFESRGLEAPVAEEYYTVSNAHVLRGIHFQVPPMDHVKIVYCVLGKVLDVFLDLRVGSPTFGQHGMLELDSKLANIVYLPRGISHGFYVLDGPALMIYKTSTVYSKNHDMGILWNSAGINWPVDNPILSFRDTQFPALEHFNSPFRYYK